MIGVFTTRQYDSRAALNAGLPSDVHVSRNLLTDVGMKWMWQMMTGQLRGADGTVLDHLGAARLVVGTGDNPFNPTDTRLGGDVTAQAALDMGYPRIEGPVLLPELDDDGFRAVFLATFDEETANFRWEERGVVSAQGVLIDRSVNFQGQKVLGAVWQLQAEIYLSR